MQAPTLSPRLASASGNSGGPPQVQSQNTQAQSSAASPGNPVSTASQAARTIDTRSVIKHFTIDMETVSLRRTAAVGSIGIHLCFPEAFPDLPPSFHCHLNVGEQLNSGRHLEWTTILWWLSTDIETFKRELTSDKSVAEGLQGILQYLWDASYGDYSKIALWGNGNDFDNEVLKSLLTSYNVTPPWSYKQDKNFRTIRDEFRDFADSFATEDYHTALGDAKWEARTLESIVRNLYHRKQITLKGFAGYEQFL